jgi:hypothetical protein
MTSEGRYARVAMVVAGLTFFGVTGCSEGQWFPEVNGPPKGDERLYYSPHNHVYTRSRAEVDADDAERRERQRHQDRLDDSRESK